MVEHLPYDSFLREAQLNDPWYVQQLMEAKEEKDAPATKKGVPVSEYTREVDVLSRLGTDIRELKAYVAAALSTKIPVDPYDGPSTIVPQAEMARRQKQHEALVARVLPHKRKGA